MFFVSVREYGLSYLSLRTCIGLWTAFFCLLLVATDASSLVCYITRFTEEAFAALICIIFIYEALEKLLHLGVHYPINKNNNLQKLTLYSYVHFSYSPCMVCLTQHICSRAQVFCCVKKRQMVQHCIGHAVHFFQTWIVLYDE